MGKLLTMKDVAERLHKSERWLRDFLKSLPRNQEFYRQAGRTKLFTEDHFTLLCSALPCPSNSNRRARANQRTTRYVAPTSGNTLTELQELLTRRRLERSSRRSNEKSRPGHSL